jgi:hypothetical protein
MIKFSKIKDKKNYYVTFYHKSDLNSRYFSGDFNNIRISGKELKDMILTNLNVLYF